MSCRGGVIGHQLGVEQGARVPRKREADVDRAAPAYAAIDRALAQPVAAQVWLYVAWLSRLHRGLGDRPEARFVGQRLQEAFQVVGELVFAGPRVARYWRTLDAVYQVLEGYLPVEFYGDLRRDLLRPLYIHPPRGPRPWQSRRLSTNPEQFEAQEAKFRATYAAEHGGKQPTDVDIAADLGISPATYYRRRNKL
jgi:hypothetical protein